MMASTSDFLNAFSQYGAQYGGIYGLAQQNYGVPASILAAQDYAESTFGTQVGNGGGIAQFEPQTINSLGSSIGQVQNPSTGILEQAAYMSQLLQRYGGNMSEALSAYNTGNPTSPTGQQYAANIISNASALGDSAAVSGQLSASQTLAMIPGPSATTLAQAAASGAAAKAACPSISWTPSSWVAWGECEGYNLILMLIGIIGVVTALKSMFVPDVSLASVAALAE